MRRFAFFLVIAMLLCTTSAIAEETTGKGQKTWEGETVEHKGFKDLGNYVIELPDFTDPAAMDKGIELINELADHAELPDLGGCTVLLKKNSAGEVVIGRNMDQDISQTPAYVFKSTTGKYENFTVSYVSNFHTTYEELQNMDEVPEDLLYMLPMLGSECLNEKGLYIEMNQREKDDRLLCYGYHSSKGETTRDDGTPWSELRACATCALQLIAQNCATVDEAVDYLKNSYDWYTVAPLPGTKFPVSYINMCFSIGDATGEYGIIELAQDEINYIPYQYGQANYYITPKWNALDTRGAGHGRLAMVSNVIESVENIDEAMTAMEPIMWRNETLWIGESHRVTDGTRLNPYSQISFEDNEGNPQMDWRSEYVCMWPVMDDGRMIIASQTYEASEQSDYDPKIKEYFDDAIAAGSLVIDDGSYKFDVNGEDMNLTQLLEKYNEYNSCEDIEKRKELKPYYDAYQHLLENQARVWTHDDNNFEAMKAAAYAKLHIRYDADGKFDPSAMSKYEKLLAYYGVGGEKDEKPLRDDGHIWTTSLNVGANCAQKKMKIRFWENDELIYEFGF